MSRHFVKVLALLVAILLPQLSFAQQYPTRPITWVVPYPAGGNPDIIVRFLAKGVGDTLGQPVIIDNRTGAAGIVGTEYVAAAKPDGYTLLYSPSSIMTVIPVINKKLSFVPLSDFVPVHGLGSYDMVLVTNASRPYKDIKSLIAFAKANPDKLNYGSTGPGTTSHMATSYFEKLAVRSRFDLPIVTAQSSARLYPTELRLALLDEGAASLLGVGRAL